jgi:hypothetical protein
MPAGPPSIHPRPRTGSDAERESTGNSSQPETVGEGWKEQGATCSLPVLRQTAIKVSVKPLSAVWQRPTVGTHVLPSAEAESNIVGYRHRLVEWAAYIGHLDFSCTGARDCAPGNRRNRGPIRSPHNQQ